LIYSGLPDGDWNILNNWFADTEMKYPATGEAGVPPLSFLIGLITGSGISRILQCGHYIGYSTLLLGFYLRMMGKKNSIYSIDIDNKVTDYTKSWVDKAGLADYVRLSVNDSANSHEVSASIDYLEGKPELIFIDSSHQYEHTIRELDLWYTQLVTGGLIALHDTSRFAITYDKTEKGGVRLAVDEWTNRKGIKSININGFVTGGKPDDNVYLDGWCLTIIQKQPA